MLGNQKENQNYSETGPFKTAGLNYWEKNKKHVLLVIAGVCLFLWWLGYQGKVAWTGEANKWLPFLGGLALIGEQLVKFIQ